MANILVDGNAENECILQPPEVKGAAARPAHRLRVRRFLACYAVLLGFLPLEKLQADSAALRAVFHPPIYGDLHPNAGTEVAFPFLKYNDSSPKDGLPETVSVSFRVFAAGTDKPILRQTQIREIPFPLIEGCDPAMNFEGSSVNFILARNNAFGGISNAQRRATMAVNIEARCFVAGIYVDGSYTSFAYSADLSGVENVGSPGPAWIKVWESRGPNLRRIEDSADVDQDKDGIDDYVLIMLGSGGYQEASQRQTIVYAASKTGVVNTTITLSGGTSFVLPQSGKTYLSQPIVP